MPIAKMKWSRRLAVAFCTMLLLCTALPVTAFADDVHITTAYQPFMYFECNEPGYWIDLGTPPHYVVETGQAAYCLQMVKDSPYGDEYEGTDGSQYYKKKIMNGLKAILEHGYPASNGGFTDNQAQYATANAIRFFLAENGIKDMPAFLRDTSNCRPKPGYEKLFKWCLKLLDYARNPDTTHAIRFSSEDLLLDENNTVFEGSVKVTLKNLNRGYKLNTSAFPKGAEITGYTGESGDILHITVPVEFSGASYKLSASGSNKSNQAVLFFYAPTTAGQQRVVTCSYELTTDRASASMIVRTPETSKYGIISIMKTDSETGRPISGVLFRIYDAEGAFAAEGCTDEAGIFTTGPLPLGEYTCREASAPQGYILDDSPHPVLLVDSGETVTITAENSPRTGTIRVFKRNASGSALPNVSFALESSGDGGLSWNSLFTRNTGLDGMVTFEGLPANDGTVFRLTEIRAAAGKMLLGDSIFLGGLPQQYSVDLAVDGRDYEIVDGNAYLYELSYTICDSSIPELPFTGGYGFLNIFAASMLLVFLGAFFMLKSKRIGVIQ